MEVLRTDNIYQNEQYSNKNVNELLNEEGRKLITFLGGRQNGTTFLVNNVAKILADYKINVAILDMTKNKSEYYIYTQNKDALKLKLKDCYEDLTNGIDCGLEVEENLTIYTNLPNENEEECKVEKILEMLLKKHQIVIIDSDFTTDINYFMFSQQVYLVQTMDLLTIQPLTEFLSKLKSQNAINNEKIRIVLNKFMDLNGISIKQLIESLAFYNEPALAYMQKLFEPNGMKYTTIPYSQQVYEMYIQTIAQSQTFLDRYPMDFKTKLDSLAKDIMKG